MTQLNLMALRHSAFYSPFLMTMAGGHLKQAGFDVTYTVQTADNLVVDRLLDGSCHVAQSAVAAGFSALENKNSESNDTENKDTENNQPDSIFHFAQINSRDGFFIAGRSADTQFTWQKLIGKEVLVDHFFQPLAMLKFALFKQGISMDQLKVIDAGDVNQIDTAFRNGIADYVHQQGPAPQQLQADGLATVVASVGEAIGPVAFSSLAATAEWLESDMARTFLDIYKQSLQQCQQESSEEIARQLHSYGFLKETDFNVLSNTIDTYKNLGTWNHDGTIGQQEYETLLNIFQHSQFITKRHPFHSLVRTI